MTTQSPPVIPSVPSEPVAVHPQLNRRYNEKGTIGQLMALYEIYTTVSNSVHLGQSHSLNHINLQMRL